MTAKTRKEQIQEMLVDEPNDVVLVGKHVVVEALERCTSHFEAHDQATEAIGTLGEHDVVAATGEAQGGRGAGDASADDDNAPGHAIGGTRDGWAAVPAVVLWSCRYMRASSRKARVTTLTLAPRAVPAVRG